ncbi:hypothetical protein BV898_12029 [Hypsibius exemplaris]|uniref:Uncharacterized protein n=1 Tax=Hypsibius exemplaris TaxID=2072580 RepID=A0A1W0WEZ9_HYPEX|nr:hypothetical protein BV898_12029 [Hypsibius exemplaris]
MLHWEMKKLKPGNTARNYELAAVPGWPSSRRRRSKHCRYSHHTVKFELRNETNRGCALIPLLRAWVRNTGRPQTTGTRRVVGVLLVQNAPTSYDNPDAFGGTVAATGELKRCPNVKADIASTVPA